MKVEIKKVGFIPHNLRNKKWVQKPSYLFTSSNSYSICLSLVSEHFNITVSTHLPSLLLMILTKLCSPIHKFTLNIFMSKFCRVQNTRIIRPIDDSFKLVSPDDVWPYKYYQWKVYSAAEAINCFKESHHPTMFNLPNSLLNVSIELNMALTKKVKTYLYIFLNTDFILVYKWCQRKVQAHTQVYIHCNDIKCQYLAKNN